MSFFDKFTGRVVDFFDDVLLPDDLRVLLVRARRAMNDGRHAEALELLTSIEARKPNNARVRELTGEVLLQLGEHGRAAQALKEALDLRPDARTALLLGLALEAASELRGARDALREAQRLSGAAAPMALEIAEVLGRVYLAMGRGHKAIHELRKAVRVATEVAADEAGRRRLEQVRLLLGRALLGRGELAEARRCSEAVLASAPLDEALETEALALHGEVLLKGGSALEAAEALASALARAPERDVLRLLSARAELDSGRVEVARERLSGLAAGLSGAERLEALVLAGRAALASGDPEGAMERLGLALELDRLHVEALLAAGAAMLAVAAGQEAPEDGVRRAEAFFVRARQQAPERVETLVGPGRCRLRLGDHQGARQLLEMAAQRGATDVSLELAEACLRSGDAPAAIRVAHRLLAASPSEVESAEAEALLAEARELLAPGFVLGEGGRREVREVRRVVEAIRGRAATTPALLPFLGELQSILEALDQPLSIAVLGEFNAGKSTLVNALIGEAVLPTGVLPTTAHIHVMRFGTRRTAELHLRDGRIEEVAFPDVKARVKRDARSIGHIEYLFPHPDLRRVHIWDTPGFNALDDDHDAYAAEALARAEAILWVTDANQPLAGSERERVDAITDPADRLVVVLNKVDRFGEGEEREEACRTVVAHIADNLGRPAHGIFAVSAAEALAATQLEGDARASGLDRSGMAALHAFVEAEVYDRAGRLKALEACRALEATLGRMRQHGQELAERLAGALAMLAEVEAELAATHARFLSAVVVEEKRMLADQVDFLLVVIAREIVEALKPTAGLMGSLLTRVELDEEDVEFVADLLIERFGQVLDRSRARVGGALLEGEQHLADQINLLAAALPAADAQVLLRRVQAFVAEARALRMVLTDRVYGRYRLLAQGRVSGPGASGQVRTQAARRDATDTERKAALRRLLPDAATAIEADLTGWAREYFDAADKFCDVVRSDLQVMAIVAGALSVEVEGLHQEES